jgi:hypothetical protein
MSNNFIKSKNNVKEDPQVKQLILTMKVEHEKELIVTKTK